jgi:tetratricopeptide (TPR) repeat protein
MVSKWRWHAPFGIACAVVILIYCWTTETGLFAILSPQAATAYYNLLVQGLRSGQLNVKRDAPPGLANLPDPYDPAANAHYVWDPRQPSYELSYYHGKLYLYFGVTPALLLFWPYSVLTGDYCTHRDAVLIFDALGLLVAAWLIYSVWRRYFSETNVWSVAAGVLALGLAPCFMDQLSNCDLHEVPRSSGFACTMLALVAIWNALHQPQRQRLWLALASLAYGLAVGSRPSLLPGIVMLLIPVVHHWRSPAETLSPKQTLSLLGAAILPALLIGMGLAAYNVRRFGSPFEFGWRYQLTDIQNPLAQPFGWHYLWFNFRLYFLQPLYWTGSFPFIQAHVPPSQPAHYYGVGNPYSGILVNFPLVWSALGVRLLWSKFPAAESLALRRFVSALLWLFVTSALTLCGFFCGSSSYLCDFMPALLILAVIGVCALARALNGRTLWRRVVLWSWSLLLVYSLTVSLLVGAKTHAGANFTAANLLLNDGRPAEAIAHFKKSTILDPGSGVFHFACANAYSRAGQLDEAIVEYGKAMERNPTNVEAMYGLSLCLLGSGRAGEGERQFQKLMELNPDILNSHTPQDLNNAAVPLAIDPDPRKRSGKVAVILAESACRQTGFKSVRILGTLAAAYAEAGRFDDAISTTRKACALASGAGEQDLLKAMQELQSLYLKHQAHPEEPATSPKGGDLK